MRIIADINDLPALEYEDVFQKLENLFPEMVKQGRICPMLRIRVPVDDPLFKLTQDILKREGYSPRGMGGEKTYPLHFQKEYNHMDYEAMAYLQPRPISEAWIAHFREDPDGRIRFQADNPADIAATGNAFIGLAAEAGRMLVSNGVKENLQAAGLRGLVFWPVSYYYYDEPAEWPSQPYWELTSDLLLPAPIPGPPVQWDEPTPREKDFRQSDFTGVPPFGLALAPYRAGGKDHFLVASKAFYRFCVDRELKMNWVPVHVEE